MTFLGFDPAALLFTSASDTGEHVEATLHQRDEDGRLFVRCFDDEGAESLCLEVRADFLDALIAARTREAAA